MANDYEKLGFEISATGNALEVLSKIEKTLERIKALQSATKNMASGVATAYSGSSSSNAGVAGNAYAVHQLAKNIEHANSAELTLINTENTLKQAKISKINANIALTRSMEAQKKAVLDLRNAELRLAALRGNEDASPENIAIAENNLAKARISLSQADKAVASATNAVEKSSIGVEKAENNLTKANLKYAESQEKALKSTKKSRKGLLSLGTAMILARKAGLFFAHAIKESGAYVENLNLFAVTFGKNYQDTAKWALDLAHNFGLASNEVIKFTGLFKQLSTAIGIANETGTEMAKTLTSLGYDLASFYNISVTSAMQKLQAGIFSGQTKPLRSIGIDITYQSIDNLLKTNEALAKFDTSSKKLDQSQKAIARMILVMQAGNNAFGDMANTINTLANQIRIFQGSLTEFKLAFGDMIQEPVRQALIYINGFIIAITDMIRIFHPIETNSKTGDNQITNIGEDAEESAEELEKLNGQLASFDKFNVLGGQKTDNGSLAITEALTKEYEKQKKIYEEALERMKNMKNQATEFAAKVKKFFVEVDSEGNFVRWTSKAKMLANALILLASIIGVKLVAAIIKLGKTLLVTHSTTALIGVSIGILIAGFLKLSEVWNDIEPMKRWGIVLGAVAAQITATAVAFKFLHMTAPAAIAAGLAMAGAIAGIAATVEQSLHPQGFANGGITNANLIMTHENGVREWVGKQGNSTAVVNDTQMSDVMRQAVAQGTYQALMSMQEQGGGTMEQPINLYIDGDKVFNATRKVAKRQGLDFSRV